MFDTVVFNTQRPLFRSRAAAAGRRVRARPARDGAGVLRRARRASRPDYPDTSARRRVSAVGPDLATARRLAGPKRREAVLLLPCDFSASRAAEILDRTSRGSGSPCGSSGSEAATSRLSLAAFRTADMIIGTNLFCGPLRARPGCRSCKACSTTAQGAPLPPGPVGRAASSGSSRAASAPGRARVAAYTRLDDQLARQAPLSSTARSSTASTSAARRLQALPGLLRRASTSARSAKRSSPDRPGEAGAALARRQPAGTQASPDEDDGRPRHDGERLADVPEPSSASGRQPDDDEPRLARRRAARPGPARRAAARPSRRASAERRARRSRAGGSRRGRPRLARPREEQRTSSAAATQAPSSTAAQSWSAPTNGTSTALDEPRRRQAWRRRTAPARAARRAPGRAGDPAARRRARGRRPARPRGGRGRSAGWAETNAPARAETPLRGVRRAAPGAPRSPDRVVGGVDETGQDQLFGRPPGERFGQREQRLELLARVRGATRIERSRRPRSSSGSLPQDCPFKLLQRRARLDAELVDERAPRLLVCSERIGLAARAVEREHQLPAERSRSGCRVDECLELGRQPPRDGRARGQRRCAARARRAAAPRSAGSPAARMIRRRGRRAAVRARARALRASAPRPSPAPLRPPPRRAARNVRGRARLARRGTDSRGPSFRAGRRRAERLPQLRDAHLKRGCARGGRPVGPELVDQPVTRDDLVRVQKQQRKQRPLTRSAERQRPPARRPPRAIPESGTPFARRSLAIA